MVYFLKEFLLNDLSLFSMKNILQMLEKGKFTILDEVRETTSKQNISFTLSIGVGTGVSSFLRLGS